MLTLLWLLCVPIVVTDLIARRIPNMWLLWVGALALGWIGWQAWHGEPRVLWVHGLGALLGLIVLLPFWWRGVMGAGDVKLFALIGLIAGYPVLLPVWCLASVAAGVHALVLLAGRLAWLTRWRERTKATATWQQIERWRAGRIGLPYGAYLAVAALVVR
ncbi:peptidase A24A prepilin type IV [Pandoraea iniqua]|uniref:Peptidase A24A prepilin type IV n=1 Tax=Pandoraea iniqua TaxID=2508288 RepID=A0A5E4VJQ6_9BURK|nr:A24 family peptidase [Pandoraea iniqua]VVE11659.1 peptidase A24A prepilin type IV [Pandoraea iniqua]VVE19760.1 peptidase A24A prepilin type IV [Pandoraea iniqua]